MKLNKLSREEFILVSILFVFHLVGILSLFSIQWRSTVLPLSAFNLLLSFIVLMLSFKAEWKKFSSFILISFLFGMTVEAIGVKTGYLFGNYTYGTNLGFKIFEVPLIIGINWGILVVISGTIAASFSKHNFLRAILASLLMTFLDFLIEPVAVASNYWTWEENQIPVYNYLCWFLLSLPLNYLFAKFNFQKQNKIAVCLYLIFVLFFSILNFY